MKMNKKILTTMAVVGATIGLGATGANADTVTVQSGDTVSEIAQKYHTTIDEIQKENKLSNVNLIYVGQQLQVNGTTQSTNAVSTQQIATPHEANVVTSQNTIQNQERAVQEPLQQKGPVASKVQQTNANANTNTNTNTNASTNQNTNYSSNVGGNDADAKAWIAQHESSNNYNARNGQYIGKYQLSAGYLNGDYSPANQEKCADQYVAQRYGSWSNAKQHWLANGWY